MYASACRRRFYCFFLHDQEEKRRWTGQITTAPACFLLLASLSSTAVEVRSRRETKNAAQSGGPEKKKRNRKFRLV